MKLLHYILNYFGYLIVKINQGNAIISNKHISWKKCIKIIKKGSTIYVDINGKIGAKLNKLL